VIGVRLAIFAILTSRVIIPSGRVENRTNRKPDPFGLPSDPFGLPSWRSNAGACAIGWQNWRPEKRPLTCRPAEYDLREESDNSMNILLWIIQILLALLFLFAGGTKLFMSQEALQAMTPPNSVVLPFWFIRFIGFCELVGVLGLILPGLFKIKRGLTPLAACGLLVIMIGAVVVSVMGLGVAAAITPLVAGVLCALVAYGRRDWR